ncbi:hypothetical protein KAU19_04900 [Candidatus Parcubacteria bacterium]|nr:hypothetical protein [Candidatus Parcubacteria bacterium]
MLNYLTFFIFITLSVSYYYLSFGQIECYEILLTISTFLFSIFTGFFIARQGNRHSAIRDRITEFDGNMSSIYRQSSHLSREVQEKISKIIRHHYQQIIKHKAWDYNFMHKSTTITSIHELLERFLSGQNLPSLSSLALERILVALRNLQQIRKNMIALHHERIPKFQWTLLYFLAGVLFLTLSVIPSQGLIFSSILKGAFASAIIFVFILLKKLNRLEFFKKTIGEESAQDVIDILEGKK